MAETSSATIERMLGDMPGGSGDAARALDTILSRSGGRFDLPRDEALYSACLFAAAQPDQDFPAFIAATALLLLDRLQDGQGGDDLYWNWDSFRAHYALADPSSRSALMNGFRIGAATGQLLIDPEPDPEECLTQPMARLLDSPAHPELLALVRKNADPRVAGAVWGEMADYTAAPADLAVIRYLYERPASIAPPAPERVRLIPWSPV
ncbi:hypothetical protein GQ651_16140 [Alphaproteobacteria bacterium GH1-50]|uniref:Uncharacterized protein n=1 Tax=Kangsaoukella pontilimi TaxID=2691042 RepID=A0A7C9MSK3_9RHOB|nr:hypothetical protein [Kangsaoukella pontilimi]MXQ09377.1 hypothetical protein [Kangsaoukella pontilimi]